MTIALPTGQPNHRFMRYVRPPIKDDVDHPPLYPLRPATRPLRLGIDVTTVPTPPEGLLTAYFTRDEIDVQLLVPAGQQVPAGWASALGNPLVRQIGFTSVEAAGRFLDSVQFSVVTETSKEWSRGTANFFDIYQQLDAQTAPADALTLALAQRHHAAAYAAAAASVGIDAIVTTSPTVGRSDVADNDVVASVTPDEAVALIGHYLRMTSNPDFDVQTDPLVGGGSVTMTHSAGTIENLYDCGVVSQMNFFRIFELVAADQADDATATALKSVRVRLAVMSRDVVPPGIGEPV